MRKIILILVGATLAGSANQTAFSKERDHVHTVRQCSCEGFRKASADAKHYASPDAASAYSGGMGGWESMTGFN